MHAPAPVETSNAKSSGIACFISEDLRVGSVPDPGCRGSSTGFIYEARRATPALQKCYNPRLDLTLTKKEERSRVV